MTIKKSVFDKFFEVEEVTYVSQGSGEETRPCVVCRTPKPLDGSCPECATRPFLCMWCYAERGSCPKGACPNCKRFGFTKFLEREKSSIYIETV